MSNNIESSYNSLNTEEQWNDHFFGAEFIKKHGRNYRLQGTNYMQTIFPFLGIDDPASYDRTILDMGCALGYGITVLRDCFPKARLIGVDHAKTAVDYCAKRYGNIAEFFHAKGEEIPDADIIICSHVMEHIEDDVAAIRSLQKRCRKLVVAVPYREDLRKSYATDTHIHSYDDHTYDEVPGLLEHHVTCKWANGFWLRLEKIYYNYYFKSLIKYVLGVDRRPYPYHIIYIFKGEK